MPSICRILSQITIKPTAQAQERDVGFAQDESGPALTGKSLAYCCGSHTARHFGAAINHAGFKQGGDDSQRGKETDWPRVGRDAKMITS